MQLVSTVVILVLIEDTLGEFYVLHVHVELSVVILVLMEDTLGGIVWAKKRKSDASRNPCSNGRYSLSL